MGESGVPLYSNIVEVDFKVDSILLGGLFTAIQNFAYEVCQQSYINKMQMQNLFFYYRTIESLIFIGISTNDKNTENSQMILEYLILAFLSRYRTHLKGELHLIDLSIFSEYDLYFFKYRNSKEKNLKKWLKEEYISSNVLEGVLNQLINYFPINELAKLNEEKLTIIGNQLISVSLSICAEEEKEIFQKLKQKTSLIFGEALFNSIHSNVRSNVFS